MHPPLLRPRADPQGAIEVALWDNRGRTLQEGREPPYRLPPRPGGYQFIAFGIHSHPVDTVIMIHSASFQSAS